MVEKYFIKIRDDILLEKCEIYNQLSYKNKGWSLDDAYLLNAIIIMIMKLRQSRIIVSR